MKNISKFLLLLLVLSNCSFNDKSRIWTGSEQVIKSKKDENKNIKDIFEKKDSVIDDINLIEGKSLALGEVNTNNKWEQRYLNKGNLIGHLSFLNNGSYEKFNKLSKVSINENILYSNKNIIFSDKKGNIGVYSLDNKKIIYKYNFYKKKFKNIKKNINLILINDQIVASDNLGYIYSLNYKKNKLNWAKNYLVPFRSNIKSLNNILLLTDEKNKIILINSDNGVKIDELYIKPAKAVSSFHNSLAIDKNNNLLLLSTTGSLYSLNLNQRKVINWFRNFNEDNELIFNAKPLIVHNDKIIITTEKKLSMYSDNGLKQWELLINSITKPVVTEKIIYILTEKKDLVIANINDGKILFSKNINKILKETTDKNYHRKYKTIKNMYLSENKLILISNNSYFFEIDLNKKVKISSIRKIPLSISSDLLFIDRDLYVVGKKNKLFKIN